MNKYVMIVLDLLKEHHIVGRNECLCMYSQQQTDHECNWSRHESGLIDR